MCAPPRIIDLLPEAIALAAPADNSTANAPANITVSADAADTDGSISYVVFYANNIQIGILNTPPYSLDWSNVAAGSYQLTATATDNLGAVTLSSPISVTVNAPAQASQALYFIETDHLDTPRQLSDAAGNVVWRWENLDAFGNNPPDEDPDGDGQRHTFNLRFPGQYHDAETGTNYNYFRDYDPSIGRYIQSDPIGLEGGINGYTYAANNPLRYIDPLGLDLTPAQQQAVISAAQDWTNSDVPYRYGGNTKKGADCSGSVSSIYNQAGINIGRLTSSGFANSSLFKPVPPSEKLQPGDVGVYTPPNDPYPHVDVYGGSDNTRVSGTNVWSAFNSKPGAPPFGPANSSWFGTPVWYRYNP